MADAGSTVSARNDVLLPAQMQQCTQFENSAGSDRKPFDLLTSEKWGHENLLRMSDVLQHSEPAAAPRLRIGVDQ
jgi:hypothetical protein